MTVTTDEKDYQAIFKRLQRTFYMCVLNFKGGVGKTSTSSHLAYYLARVYGLRVLLIDCDFQSNAGKVLCDEVPGPTLTQVLGGAGIPLYQAIRRIREDCELYLLPADIHLDTASKYIVSQGMGGYTLLKRSLKALEQGKMLDQFGRPVPGPILADIAAQFDIVIFDCASINAVVESAFLASDALYIPVEMKFLSMDGLYMLREKVDALMANMSHQIEIIGITPYNIDNRFKMTKDYLDLIRVDFKIEVTSPVRTDAQLGDAQRVGKTLFEYNPGSHFAIDMAAVGDELYSRIEESLLAELEARQ